MADLEIGYQTRGGQVVNCDGARKLAVDTKREQDRLTDLWLDQVNGRRRWWWPF